MNENKKTYNIALFCRNWADVYSGGRYCAWMIAEALSHANHSVHFITEVIPAFYDDFNSYPNHHKININLTEDYQNNLPTDKIDIVIVIPGMDDFVDFYTYAIQFAEKNNAHIILLNFETPNWFNETSPKKRDPNKWNNWQRISRYASGILSNADICTQYAEKYFQFIPKHTKFLSAHPSINSLVSDQVHIEKKEKRILMLTRFSGGEHKGGYDILNLFGPELSGYTVVFLVGAGEIPKNLFDEFSKKANEFNITLEVKYRLSDREKFYELKKAFLLLFPSFFEGYGYPPIEALYCNTPCIAFDLPVLRETCQDNLIYAELGNWNEFKEKMIQALKESPEKNLNSQIEHTAKFENYSQKLNKIMDDISSEPLPENFYKNCQNPNTNPKVCIISPHWTHYSNFVLSFAAKGYSIKFIHVNTNDSEIKQNKSLIPEIKLSGVTFETFQIDQKIQSESFWTTLSYALYAQLDSLSYDEIHFCDSYGLIYYSALAQYEGLSFASTKLISNFSLELQEGLFSQFDLNLFDFLKNKTKFYLEKENTQNIQSSSNPLISICVTHFNRPEFIDQLIESVKNQSYKNYEVILVDDGSPSSEAISKLKSYENEFKDKNWKIIYQENKYLGAARNRATQEAKGDYLLFLDDDDYAEPNILKTYTDVAIKTGADLLTTNFKTFDHHHVPNNNYNSEWIFLGPSLHTGISYNCFGGANIFIKEDVFHKLGGFTEDYGIGAEDWEFLMKANVENIHHELIPKSLLWIRKLENSMLHTTNKKENHLRAVRPLKDKIDKKYQFLLDQAIEAYRLEKTSHQQTQSISSLNTSIENITEKSQAMHARLNFFPYRVLTKIDQHLYHHPLIRKILGFPAKLLIKLLKLFK